jgi:hypothetical protein
VKKKRKNQMPVRPDAGVVKVRVLTNEHIAAVQHAFRVMNFYASPEAYKPSGGTDPIAVLGEVYFALAQGFAATLRDVEAERTVFSTHQENRT